MTESPSLLPEEKEAMEKLANLYSDILFTYSSQMKGINLEDPLLPS